MEQLSKRQQKNPKSDEVTTSRKPLILIAKKKKEAVGGNVTTKITIGFLSLRNSQKKERMEKIILQ